MRPNNAEKKDKGKEWLAGSVGESCMKREMSKK